MNLRVLIYFNPKRSKVEAITIPVDSYGNPVGKVAREIYSRLGKEEMTTLGYLIPFRVGTCVRLPSSGFLAKEGVRNIFFSCVDSISGRAELEDIRIAYREAIRRARGFGIRKKAIILPGNKGSEELFEICKGICKDLRVFGKDFEKVYLVVNSPNEKDLVEKSKSFLRPF